MLDHDQDAGESCKDILTTKDGIRLALYLSNISCIIWLFRFPNAVGALLYPIYGQGELPQAFCRRAAVKGCVYVLRMPVISVVFHKDSGNYKSVKLVCGQELTSDQLVMDPSFTITSLNSPSKSLQDVSKLARGICITNSSLKPDISHCLVIYPPRSMYPDQATSIRVLQLGSNLAVCPSEKFVFYISALCDNALDALFSVHSDETTENTEVKPTLLWSALHIQDLIQESVGPVVTTPTPDGNLNYNDLLDTTSKLFKKLYPDDEFFAETSNTDEDSSDKLEDDGEVVLDS